MIDLNNLTHGAEHELADWNAQDLKDPCGVSGLSRDLKDVTIVNNNGIANDPSLKYYQFGGEIKTPPTESVLGQCHVLSYILERWPDASINYRSNLHWHIRVPGLKEDLTALKRLARYNAQWLPLILDVVEPIRKPLLPSNPEGAKAYSGALRRYKRCKVSHHTVLPANRLIEQVTAQTIQAFFEAEVPHTAVQRKPMWHAQPRAAVNVRQLLQTETLEFRHFPGTLDTHKLAMVGQWCLCYIECALGDWDIPNEVNPIERFLTGGGDFNLIPRFQLYQHDLEVRYRATCHDASLPKHVIKANIAAILAGTFTETD